MIITKYIDFTLASDAELNRDNLIPIGSNETSFLLEVSDEHYAHNVLIPYRIEVTVNLGSYAFRISRIDMDLSDDSIITEALMLAVDSILGVPFRKAIFSGVNLFAMFPILDYNKVKANIEGIEGYILEEECDYSTYFKSRNTEIKLTSIGNSEIWNPHFTNIPDLNPDFLVVNLKSSDNTLPFFNPQDAELSCWDRKSKFLKLGFVYLLDSFIYKSVQTNPFIPQDHILSFQNTENGNTSIDLGYIFCELLCGELYDFVDLLEKA